MEKSIFSCASVRVYRANSNETWQICLGHQHNIVCSNDIADTHSSKNLALLQSTIVNIEITNRYRKGTKLLNRDCKYLLMENKAHIATETAELRMIYRKHDTHIKQLIWPLIS